MLEKTRGIVLKNIKYGDSSLISHIFTEKFGRRSFIFKGLRSKNRRARLSLLQPLMLVDLDFYLKETREILQVKEFSGTRIFSDIPYNPVKSAQSMLLAEVLDKCLLEEMKNEELFEFLINSIEYLDVKTSDYSNFHLALLMKLTRYLGIPPGGEYSESHKYFDLLEGRFTDKKPLHKDFPDTSVSSCYYDFLTSPFEKTSLISISGKTRNFILKGILRYYSIHNYNMENLKSPGILMEVFR